MLAGSLEFPDAGTPAPACGWTPESQIANMLELCSAQMESALQDSDQAVEALIKVFESVAETSRTLSAISAQLPQETRTAINHALDQQLETLARQIGAAVISFQFYDKLTQRLGHVRYSLSSLAQFVCDRAQSSEQDQWRRMLNALRRLYRTEEERRIFQMMTEGISVDLPPVQPAPAGEVELF
jgi:ribosomal protein L16 Arg81 hydroxylase